MDDFSAYENPLYTHSDNSLLRGSVWDFAHDSLLPGGDPEEDRVSLFFAASGFHTQNDDETMLPDAFVAGNPQLNIFNGAFGEDGPSNVVAGEAHAETPDFNQLLAAFASDSSTTGTGAHVGEAGSSNMVNLPSAPEPGPSLWSEGIGPHLLNDLLDFNMIDDVGAPAPTGSAHGHAESVGSELGQLPVPSATDSERNYETDLQPPPAQRRRLYESPEPTPPSTSAAGGPIHAVVPSGSGNDLGSTNNPHLAPDASGTSLPSANPALDVPQNTANEHGRARVPADQLTLPAEVTNALQDVAERVAGYQLLLGMNCAVEDSKAALQVAIDNPSEELTFQATKLYTMVRDNASEVAQFSDRLHQDQEARAQARGIYMVHLEPAAVKEVTQKVSAVENTMLDSIIGLFRDEDLLNLKQFDDGQNPELFRSMVAWVATTQFPFHLYLRSRQGEQTLLDSLADVLVDHPKPGEELFPGVQTLRPHDSFNVARAFALWRLAQLEKFVATEEKAKAKQKGKAKESQQPPAAGAPTVFDLVNLLDQETEKATKNTKAKSYENARRCPDGCLRLATGRNKEFVSAISNNNSTIQFKVLSKFFSLLHRDFRSSLTGRSVLEEYLEDQSNVPIGSEYDSVWRCPSTMQSLICATLRLIYKKGTLNITALEVRKDPHARLTQRCKIRTAIVNGEKWWKDELKEFTIFRGRVLGLMKLIIAAFKSRIPRRYIKDLNESYQPANSVHLSVEGRSYAGLHRATNADSESDDDDDDTAQPALLGSESTIQHRQDNIKNIPKYLPWIRGKLINPSVFSELSLRAFQRQSFVAASSSSYRVPIPGPSSLS